MSRTAEPHPRARLHGARAGPDGDPDPRRPRCRRDQVRAAGRRVDAPLGHPQRPEPRRDGLVPGLQPQQAQRRGRPRGSRRFASGSSSSRPRPTSSSRTSGPGVMAASGSATTTSAPSTRAIIYASSSGYGQTGPYVKRPGQDLLIQALSGLMFLTGRRDDPPTALGIGVTDQYTALHIAIGDPRGARAPRGHRRGPEDRGRPLLLHRGDAAAGAHVLLRTWRGALRARSRISAPSGRPRRSASTRRATATSRSR